MIFAFLHYSRGASIARDTPPWRRHTAYRRGLEAYHAEVKFYAISPQPCCSRRARWKNDGPMSRSPVPGPRSIVPTNAIRSFFTLGRFLACSSLDEFEMPRSATLFRRIYFWGRAAREQAAHCDDRHRQSRPAFIAREIVMRCTKTMRYRSSSRLLRSLIMAYAFPRDTYGAQIL